MKALTARIFLALAFVCLSLSCSGADGKTGTTGATGPAGTNGTNGKTGATGPAGDPGRAGDAGPAGEPGPAGADGAAGAGGTLPQGVLTTSCLGPCHGFTGIVEQWKTSTHYATAIANLGGTEVDTWTGATVCGNCHAIDAIEQRVAGNVTYVGTAGPTKLAQGQINYLASTTTKITEAVYAGQATVAEVNCTTCHDSAPANDPHVTGKNYNASDSFFPLRVPTGANDQAIIEKSSAVGVSDGTPAGKYGKGNACMWCHKSRKDVTNYITAANFVTSVNWGPHEGPQADIYTGKGGYHYTGQTYGGSTHQSFADGCVTCHMPDVATNQNVGNHSFYAKLSTCQTQGCHVNATNFDPVGGNLSAGIQELRVALNGVGLLTRGTAAPYPNLVAADLADTNLSLDKTRPDATRTTALTGDQAGALYNYLLLARGAAGGVHNPKYVRQLVFDSVKAITGTAPVTVPTRPLGS